MPAVKYQLNKRNVHLEAEPGNLAPILTRSGERGWLRWFGFLPDSVARQLPNAAPVKLDMVAVSDETPFMGKWHYLKPGECVQGCRVGEGVFGVLSEKTPKVIPRGFAATGQFSSSA
jgi:hypothetical protein